MAEAADAYTALAKEFAETQQSADAKAQAFARGTPGVELGEVMVEAQKAGVAFRATVEVRNRFVAAYQDIRNMPI